MLPVRREAAGPARQAPAAQETAALRHGALRDTTLTDGGGDGHDYDVRYSIFYSG